MLLQLQRYNLEIVYLPGEQQVVADVLSRAPVEQPRGEQLGKAEVFQIVDQELAVIQEREFVPVSDARMAAVRSATVQDQEQATLSQIIYQGWSPNISSHCEGLLEFKRPSGCYKGVERGVSPTVTLKSSRFTINAEESQSCCVLAWNGRGYQASYS